LFTGTLIKDLYAAVEKAEARAGAGSDKSSEVRSQEGFEARAEEGTEQAATEQAAASRSGKSLNHERAQAENPSAEL
jgi:hypothetical protein